MMFHKKLWLLIFLCGYANIVQSINLNRNNSPETKVKFHVAQNGRSYKNVPSLRIGKESDQMKIVKRQAALIVDEVFDLLPYSHSENSSEIRELNEDDGSGIDAFDENEASITELHSTTEDYGHQQKTSPTTISTQYRTNATEQSKSTAPISTMIDSDGSGDGITTVLTEDDTAKETTPHGNTTPGLVGQETIPDICMNFTCDASELFVSVSEESSIIAEGTNFTFSCSSNYSNHVSLYWYKSNGSMYFLQAFGHEKQLHLTLTDTKSIHSGKYICVHWVNKETCCSLQSDLKVYEIPLYRYHLIILGLLVAACLIICIVLSVRQSKMLKSYSRQFVKKHGSVKSQLL